MSKCARRLAPRWGALGVLAYLVGLGIVRLVYGAMPATSTIQTQDHTGTIMLPLVLPRLADTLVVFLFGSAIAWFVIDIDNDKTAELFGFTNAGAFDDAQVWSTALGVVGAGFALWGGLIATTTGSVITAVIIIWLYLLNVWRRKYYFRNWNPATNRKLVMAHWWGGLVMFGILTIFTGLLPALAYTGYTIAILIGIELIFGAVFGTVVMSVRFFGGPFKRTFLVCEPGSDCQESATT